jgi:hypothetical protein
LFASVRVGVDVNVDTQKPQTREIRIRGQEKVFATQDVKQAEQAAGALAKFAYSRCMFLMRERRHRSPLRLHTCTHP